MESYYPPGAFYFGVQVFNAGPSGPQTAIDASFQEVSGIKTELDVEEVVEGGENRFVHRLPRTTRYTNLVLKRGAVTVGSALAVWCGQTVGSNLAHPIRTRNLLVTLFDQDKQPAIAWGFVNAYPLRWEVAALSSMDNRILTETMELAYSYFERLNLGGRGGASPQLDQLTARLSGG